MANPQLVGPNVEGPNVESLSAHQSPRRAIAVLRVFTESEPHLSVSEIARRLDLAPLRRCADDIAFDLGVRREASA